jgi:four helix bundle protein
MHCKDLAVWQKAHALVLATYRITRSFPDEEKFRLTNQLCRAAASVPANIVEGNARQSTNEYIQFLFIARGSLEESRYYAILAKDLEYLTQTDYDKFESESESVSRMLNVLVSVLRKRGKG